MKQANRLNDNQRWLTAQMNALRNGTFVLIWHEHSARINQIDNEIKLVGMQVNKEVGMHYVVYREMEKL